MSKVTATNVQTKEEDDLDVWYIQIDGAFADRAIMNCKLLGKDLYILFPIQVALQISTHLAHGKDVGFTIDASGDEPIGGVPVAKYAGRVTFFQK